MKIEIIRTDSTNPDFIELVSFLDADLKIRDGEDHAFYSKYNKIDAIRNVVVAYANGQAVGCGAFKNYENKTAELKRMFVRPEFRNMGLAKRVLQELENWAAELKFEKFVLETGKAQPEAISLYTKTGYSIIPNYGQYENVENSVCMEKNLIQEISEKDNQYFI